MTRSTVLSELHNKYEEWLNVPFPELGKDIDGYPEYNADLAGLTTRILGRQEADLGDIPKLPKAAQDQLLVALASGTRDAADLRRNEEMRTAIESLASRAIEEQREHTN